MRGGGGGRHLGAGRQLWLQERRCRQPVPGLLVMVTVTEPDFQGDRQVLVADTVPSLRPPHPEAPPHTQMH